MLTNIISALYTNQLENTHVNHKSPESKTNSPINNSLTNDVSSLLPIKIFEF